MSMIYISGKISGDPEYRRKFYLAKRELLEKGWSVFNPAELDHELEIKRIMGIDLAALLNAAAVYALPDHVASDGALIETSLADYVGIPVYTKMEDVPDLFDQES